MGRGNVCVTGSYEGLFYIDNDDLQVWRKDGPDGKEPEIRMMADISLMNLLPMTGTLMKSRAATRRKTFSDASAPNCGSSAPASSLRPTRTSGSEMSVGSSSKTSCFTSAWRITSGHWPSSLSRKTATPTVRAHGWPAFRNGAIGNTSIA